MLRDNTGWEIMLKLLLALRTLRGAASSHNPALRDNPGLLCHKPFWVYFKAAGCPDTGYQTYFRYAARYEQVRGKQDGIWNVAATGYLKVGGSGGAAETRYCKNRQSGGILAL